MRRNVARLSGGRRAGGVGAACIAAGLILAGCTGPAPSQMDPLEREPGHVYLYGTDGNMMNAIGSAIHGAHPDAVAGMKGTMPLTPVNQTFRDRLLALDPSLVDFTYASETYDAVVISALAAEIAGSVDSQAIAAQINGVTVDGNVCESPARCLGHARVGLDVRYRGLTLALGGFTDAGEPSASTYGILRFGAGNQIASSLTQFVPAGNAATATQAAPPPGTGSGASDEPLRIGALLPHTGALSSAGPPMFAAGRLAVEDINAAGGVLGHDVEWVDGDDGTSPEVAEATVHRLIEQEGVQVIIGAGASGVSRAVLPIVRDAGVILFSPCNTAAVLTTEEDGGLYFRTAPPDGLQAAALADIIVRDGTRKLSIIYRKDAYGEGLANSTKDNLISAGLNPDDVKLLEYDAEAANALVAGDTSALDFTAIGDSVHQADPDGVLIIGFDETANIVDALVQAGITSITN
jgi:branched-chain amino acid transport system substrate-binding protein